MATKKASRSASKTKRPQYDRVVNPYQDPWTAAVEPIDRATIFIESEFGSLENALRYATPELAAKFKSARKKFDEALDAQLGDQSIDIETAKHRCGVYYRGLQALQEEVSGKYKAPPMITWGDNLCVPSNIDIAKAVKDNPDKKVWSLEELIRLVSDYIPTVHAVKENWPGAYATGPASPSGRGGGAEPNDELPW